MSADRLDAVGIAEAVRSRRSSAAEVTEAALRRIEREDARYNCFTAVVAAQARRDAARIDADIAAGRDPGPLAGAPFAVKNLFDIANLTTLAGSKINRDNPPAQRDASVVAALRRAGAVLLGALNMDEYAYGFTTENTHYGPTRNPHDLSRSAGGSSGGSGAAVAAGLVPLTLGTDTGGSIRVPAALCGIFGLKPTFGRVSRDGVALFSAPVDHVGPLARSVRDLACAYDLMQDEPVSPTLAQGIGGLRIALPAGYFPEHAQPPAGGGPRTGAPTPGARRQRTLPHALEARAPPTIIPGAGGARPHPKKPP